MAANLVMTEYTQELGRSVVGIILCKNERRPAKQCSEIMYIIENEGQILSAIARQADEYRAFFFQ